MEQLQSHIWLTASSYMGKSLRISSYIRKPFLIHIWLCNCSTLNFLIYEENLIFFFISVSSIKYLQISDWGLGHFICTQMFLRSTTLFHILGILYRRTSTSCALNILRRPVNPLCNGPPYFCLLLICDHGFRYRYPNHLSNELPSASSTYSTTYRATIY